MKSEILQLLREAARSGSFLSGQELCTRFSVSRTAVWKAMEQLKAEGYEIEAVRNRGYRLKAEPEDVYSAAGIRSLLGTQTIAGSLQFAAQIGSTNEAAAQAAREGAPEGYLVAADRQTAGRGRRGRTWISPAGCNVYFSVMLRPQIRPDRAPMMTLLMAQAVCEAMEELCPASAPESMRPLIKWPNDIVIDGRKVCGMLTEMSAEMGDVRYVVIGVGINVKRQEFAPELEGHAVSLEEAWGIGVSRSALTAAVCNRFEPLYQRFLREQDLGFLRRPYLKRLVNAGRQVRVLDPAGEYDGIARGINETGELLVELPDGTVREVYAGEVSVRGIYGYTE
ncbi:MAG: biotin--[acetyl-CoA-carboxylase] ligase [Lachnospiraceae bacterium]|nr:biotin--[acetyl-CoA-carboxylase] ligase [Lachnospiraceae bacterium]